MYNKPALGGSVALTKKRESPSQVCGYNELNLNVLSAYCLFNFCLHLFTYMFHLLLMFFPLLTPVIKCYIQVYYYYCLLYGWCDDCTFVEVYCEPLRHIHTILQNLENQSHTTVRVYSQ